MVQSYLPLYNINAKQNKSLSIEEFKNFTCLGSILANNFISNMEKEISKWRNAFGKLNKISVSENHGDLHFFLIIMFKNHCKDLVTKSYFKSKTVNLNSKKTEIQIRRRTLDS